MSRVEFSSLCRLLALTLALTFPGASRAFEGEDMLTLNFYSAEQGTLAELSGSGDPFSNSQRTCFIGGAPSQAPAVRGPRRLALAMPVARFSLPPACASPSPGIGLASHCASRAQRKRCSRPQRTSWTGKQLEKWTRTSRSAAPRQSASIVCRRSKPRPVRSVFVSQPNSAHRFSAPAIPDAVGCL